MENKIPFYNMVNMLLTGFVFIGCCIFIYFNDILNLLILHEFPKINIGSESIFTISFFAVVYEIGYIINRLGSIISEPILIKTKAIPFDNDYKKFSELKKEYPILNTLSREYAVARTSLTLFFIVTILAAIQSKCILALLFCLISLLFGFSCRKHAKKIVVIMA